MLPGRFDATALALTCLREPAIPRPRMQSPGNRTRKGRSVPRDARGRHSWGMFQALQALARAGPSLEALDRQVRDRSIGMGTEKWLLRRPIQYSFAAVIQTLPLAGCRGPHPQEGRRFMPPTRCECVAKGCSTGAGQPCPQRSTARYPNIQRMRAHRERAPGVIHVAPAASAPGRCRRPLNRKTAIRQSGDWALGNFGTA